MVDKRVEMKDAMMAEKLAERLVVLKDESKAGLWESLKAEKMVVMLVL